VVGWHRWVRRQSDDGAQFAVCQRCGREHATYESAWGNY